ncbi:winged helix-turn-helix domain-containing protein [uncultured Ruminococcus sp.]|uniref:winged helix-turn-helix domain-containing protein n=1 Tax=uncultured Ruminococcus sp. TaxID=165186 RepID=UPI0025D827A6|nr:winged helix-turn-helix domain-containing protein [uncultured Ruminococcus sp.]
MKKIGILISAIIDPLQIELIEAIYETAAAYGYDVIVMTNTTNAHDHFPHNDYTTGEENIFTLIETVKLDGIIFASQLFKKTVLKQQIAERIRNIGIPCVDTGGSLYGFETVQIPQKRAFYDMTSHLIGQHHCRRLLCHAGFEGDADSEKRIAGFMEAAELFHAEKPYNPTILLLRISAVLKRSAKVGAVQKYHDVEVSTVKGSLTRNGSEQILTKNEMIIFQLLLDRQGEIVTRDELMTALWDNDEFVNDNALSVNISRLRGKLAELGLPEAIETRKKQGYVLK